MKPVLADKDLNSSLNLDSMTQELKEANTISKDAQESFNTREDIKVKLAKLEAERVEMATKEIQAILDKYGVRLQGVVMLPANQIQIVPER